MPKVSVRVTKNRIPDIVALLPKTAERMTEKTARAILAAADEEVPVDTGRLRESGDVGRTDNGYQVTYDAEYAVMVHNGTVRQPPNPWLARAVERARPEWDAAVRELREEIERG